MLVCVLLALPASASEDDESEDTESPHAPKRFRCSFVSVSAAAVAISRRCWCWMRTPRTKGLKPPPASSHPVDVGLRTEAAILAGLVRRGYQVLVPFGTNQRYDLVVDMNGEFVRAQCKTGRLRKGVVIFSTRSVRSNMKQVHFRDYDGEVELFLVYCAETGGIYAVPVEEAPQGYGSLRVEPTRNGQNEGVRWGPATFNCPPSSIGRALDL
jgi:PD-(D/E)XK endonuclease